MDEMALTRSRPKHPPAKVAVEAQRIKSKVEKSDTNRRQKMKVDDPRNLRLAEMDREIEAKNRKEASHVKASNPQDLRQRIENLASKDLPDRAEKLAARENIDYGAAVRQSIAEDEAFHHLPGSGVVPDGGTEMERAVAARMDEDKENYA